MLYLVVFFLCFDTEQCVYFLYVCVWQEVAKRTTTYSRAVEIEQGEDDDDDNGVESIEEEVFHQQVRLGTEMFEFSECARMSLVLFFSSQRRAQSIPDQGASAKIYVYEGEEWAKISSTVASDLILSKETHLKSVWLTSGLSTHAAC